jgi:hypothetical protein
MIVRIAPLVVFGAATAVAAGVAGPVVIKGSLFGEHAGTAPVRAWVEPEQRCRIGGRSCAAAEVQQVAFASRRDDQAGAPRPRPIEQAAAFVVAPPAQQPIAAASRRDDQAGGLRPRPVEQAAGPVVPTPPVRQPIVAPADVDDAEAGPARRDAPPPVPAARPSEPARAVAKAPLERRDLRRDGSRARPNSRIAVAANPVTALDRSARRHRPFRFGPPMMARHGPPPIWQMLARFMPPR